MNSSNQANTAATSDDRVRRVTSSRLNREIDRQTDRNIRRYIGANRETIIDRMHQLDKEWDIERVLEVRASALALTGLVLGLTVNKRWFAVPGIILAFLLQHGLQGWCPPIPILRRLGVRTRGEIDREKYALKAYLI
jgi:hypothetical protein